MKLWLLRPQTKAAWQPWYDKAFGFVVRAETAREAREYASDDAGDEGHACWLDATQSTCDELLPEGLIGVVLKDFASA